jgi:hypothetical protein
LIGFSGRLRSGFAGFRHYNNKQIENQPTTNIIKSPQQNTHHNHKKNQQKISKYKLDKTGEVEAAAKPARSGQNPARSHQIRRELARSGEISPNPARSHQIR